MGFPPVIFAGTGSRFILFMALVRGRAGVDGKHRSQQEKQNKNPGYFIGSSQKVFLLYSLHFAVKLANFSI